MEVGYPKVELVCPPKFTTEKVAVLNSHRITLNSERQTTPTNLEGKKSPLQSGQPTRAASSGSRSLSWLAGARTDAHSLGPPF